MHERGYSGCGGAYGVGDRADQISSAQDGTHHRPTRWWATRVQPGDAGTAVRGRVAMAMASRLPPARSPGWGPGGDARAVSKGEPGSKAVDGLVAWMDGCP
jgi:hypothetical protein